MNETQTLPTDTEIVALMRDGNNCNYNDEAEHIAFARAVLAKWGTPAPVGAEPVAQWQKRHPNKEYGLWQNTDEGDAKWWRDKAGTPGWEARALYAAPQQAVQAPDALQRAGAIAVSAAKTNSRDIADWREDMDRIAAIAAQQGGQ